MRTRGTGYYIRTPQSRFVYVVWKDNKGVTTLSTAYPGHSTGTVKRRVKNGNGFTEVQEVPIPLSTAKYNLYMGGVDKSDQFISYNLILRRTVCYWKPMFYHLLEIIVTNASIIKNWQRMTSGQKRVSQTQFRDNLFKEIIAKFGKPVIPTDSFTISHGSRPFKDRARCVHCPYQPALSQVYERDCHSLWHSTANLKVRNTWIKNHTQRQRNLDSVSNVTHSSRGGCLKGSKNLKKRRGNYK